MKQLHLSNQLPLTLGQKVPAQSLSVVLATGTTIEVDLGDTNYGTPGADTLRTAAMLGLGSTAVSDSNPVPISDAGGSITVDGEVEVTASVLPTGAATEVTLSSVDTKLDALSSGITVTATNLDIRDLSSASDSVAAVQSGAWSIGDITGTITLPTGAATEATLAAIDDTLSTGITVDAADLDIRDLNSSTDSVSAVQSGAWSITDISGTVSLPTGASTETTLAAISAKLPAALGQAVAGSSLAAVLSSRHEAAATPISVRISDGTSFITPATGRSSVALVRNNYVSSPVTTAAYVQLIASTSATINQLDIFDSSGQTMVLAIGAVSSEVDTYYISPGGNGKIDLSIPAGSRVSVKAVSANASVGELTITALS